MAQAHKHTSIQAHRHTGTGTVTSTFLPMLPSHLLALQRFSQQLETLRQMLQTLPAPAPAPSPAAPQAVLDMHHLVRVCRRQSLEWVLNPCAVDCGPFSVSEHDINLYAQQQQDYKLMSRFVQRFGLPYTRQCNPFFPTMLPPEYPGPAPTLDSLMLSHVPSCNLRGFSFATTVVPGLGETHLATALLMLEQRRADWQTATDAYQQCLHAEHPKCSDHEAALHMCAIRLQRWWKCRECETQCESESETQCESSAERSQIIIAESIAHGCHKSCPSNLLFECLARHGVWTEDEACNTADLIRLHDRKYAEHTPVPSAHINYDWATWSPHPSCTAEEHLGDVITEQYEARVASRFPLTWQCRERQKQQVHRVKQTCMCTRYYRQDAAARVPAVDQCRQLKLDTVPKSMYARFFVNKRGVMLDHNGMLATTHSLTPVLVVPMVPVVPVVPVVPMPVSPKKKARTDAVQYVSVDGYLHTVPLPTKEGHIAQSPYLSHYCVWGPQQGPQRVIFTHDGCRIISNVSSFTLAMATPLVSTDKIKQITHIQVHTS